MGLFPKNKLNQAMFFFPNKINTAQNQQQFLNAQKKPKKLKKKLKAEARIKEKEQKTQKIQEHKEQRAEKTAEKTTQKQLEKKTKKLQKQINQQFKLEEQTQKHRQLNSTNIQQHKKQNAPIMEVEEMQMKFSCNRRSVTLPARYCT